MNGERFTYRIVEIRPLSEYVSQILLTPASTVHLTYEAGQYVNVVHDEHTISSLSIACAPNQEHVLEFHLFHPKENVLANHLMDLAHQKKSWQLLGPFGSCTVSRIYTDKPIIFIARGTGFAPIKAVIETMLHSANAQSIKFYWSMANANHFYLLDLLQNWRNTTPHFSYTLISQDTNVSKPQYLLEQIYQLHPNFSQTQYYCSGSPAFVNSVFSALKAKGLPNQFFYSDVETQK